MAWYDKWAVMAIAAAIGLGGYNWIRWNEVDATILAYWVQAIGSIAAIVGSFALARLSDRKRDAIEKNSRIESQAAIRAIAYELAHDTFLAVLSIFLKFEGCLVNQDHKKIGIERLADLQESLRIFTTKDIPPNIYAEILIFKREVAYTLTAVDQHNRGLLVTKERIKKAKRRLYPILHGALRI